MPRIELRFGAVDDGAVDDGAVDDGAVDDGAVVKALAALASRSGSVFVLLAHATNTSARQATAAGLR